MIPPYRRARLLSAAFFVAALPALALAVVACEKSPDKPSSPPTTASSTASSAASTTAAAAAASSQAATASATAVPPPAAPQPIAGWVCPEDMVATVGGTCIDKYEASSDGGEQGKADGSGTAIRARSVAGVLPLVRVTFGRAKKACANAGKHLCKDAEWLAACQGAAKRKYSYGDEFEARRCNDWDVSNKGLAGVVKTGSLARCMSPEGAFDLSNNAGEWVDSELRDPKQAMVRGGTYNMTVHDTECGEDDFLQPRDVLNDSIGFRCCKPATKK